MKRQTPESYVALQICDYLTAHNIRYRRNQVGRAQFGKYSVPFGEKGEADYTAYIPVPNAKGTFYILHIECKAKNGRHAEIQKDWRDMVERYGEYYLVAKSYEPVESFLKEKGIR
jgi:hypothetical protein